MELRQKFTTYLALLSLLTATGLFAPVLQFPWNAHLVVGLLIVFIHFLNRRERFILKKNHDLFLALYFYIPLKHQKKVHIALQLIAALAGLPFFAIAMLMWFHHVLAPVELWKLIPAIGAVLSAGLYFTWYTLYLVNNPPKIDRRIIKVLKKKR